MKGDVSLQKQMDFIYDTGNGLLVCAFYPLKGSLYRRLIFIIESCNMLSWKGPFMIESNS